VNDVLDELDELQAKYQFQSIVFHDDQFVIRREWAEEFCEGMHRRGHVARGVKWWAASRSDVVCTSPELFQKMRAAGLEILSIGFESFSDPMLQWMKKGTTREENFAAAKICGELGIHLFANVIFGMPFSDAKWYLQFDRDSLRSIERIKPRYFSPSFFSPIPGSWFFEWAIENDLLVGDDTQSTGSRRPEEAKIKGVDYVALQRLLDRYRARYEPHLLAKRPLRLKLRQFAEKPLNEKLATLWRRSGVAAMLD
jgi:radical SAM superfamily enzyme YgiQ (UPF0313 family)